MSKSLSWIDEVPGSFFSCPSFYEPGCPDWWPEELKKIELNLPARANPNPCQTWKELQVEAELSYKFFGVVFFWTVRNALMTVCEIHLLNAMEVSSCSCRATGEGYYVVHRATGKVQLPSEDVVCVRRQLELEADTPIVI